VRSGEARRLLEDYHRTSLSACMRARATLKRYRATIDAMRRVIAASPRWRIRGPVKHEAEAVADHPPREIEINPWPANCEVPRAIAASSVAMYLCRSAAGIWRFARRSLTRCSQRSRM